MRRIWRLLRILIAVAGHTIYTSLAVRRRPAEERPAFRARRQQAGAAFVCRTMGLRLSMRGAVPPEKPMLFVCNHVSAFDPLMLGALMPLAFAGKAELGAWPFVGWVCRTFGMLFVDRTRRTSTTSFVELVRDKLQTGVSILVFPEGTTGWGDTVKPFKTGAFEAVAHSEGDAVLPLYLDVWAVEGEPAAYGRRREVSHNEQTFLRHTWQLLGLKHVDVQVWIGEPVTTGGRDRKTLARLSHQAVCRLARQPVEA